MVICLQIPAASSVWKNYFCQLLNVHDINYIRQIEMHTAKPLVPHSISVEVKIDFQKLKRHKLSGLDQILTVLIQAGSKHYVLGYIKLLILFGIRKNCHSSGTNLLLYLFLKRVTRLAIVIVGGHHCYQLHTKCYPLFICQN
jgi:hypothetical protein